MFDLLSWIYSDQGAKRQNASCNRRWQDTTYKNAAKIVPIQQNCQL